MTKGSSSKIVDISGLIGWLLLSAVIAWFGSQFAADNWYLELNKPGWTPPGWIFGPVWTILYILMAVAAWLIWRNDRKITGKLSLKIYLIKMVCNGLWSYLFFGLHQIGLAFLDIIVLLVLLIWVIILFYKEKKSAGIILIPYLIWVSFASVLNLSIWLLNC